MNENIFKECFYQNYKLNGEFKQYDANGNILIKCKFINDNINGV